MYSLYDSLITQHSRQLTPVSCARSIVNQLHQYFEDVVLDNNLSALVIENLALEAHRPAHEVSRIKRLDKTARSLYLMLGPADALTHAVQTQRGNSQSIFLRSAEQFETGEHFIVIADAHFSALLVAREKPSDKEQAMDAIWTFEPEIVYSALEYLMARIHAEYAAQARVFVETVRGSMPQETSLSLAQGVTTRFVELLQHQAKRELAINRIANTVRDGEKLDIVLATAANEVARTLNIESCAVRIEGGTVGRQITQYYFAPEAAADAQGRNRMLSELNALSARLSHSGLADVSDGVEGSSHGHAHAAVPMSFNGSFLGLIFARTSASRPWAESEILMLHTVASQLAVAVNQAHMIEEMQQQALTDALTGCYNRRCFEMQLERDLHLATRMRQPLSLVMMDVDNFKLINDSAGHDAGDRALRTLSETLRAELRAVDTAARFGGDEFVVILPQANSEGALVVAERLRRSIERTEVPGFGAMTASFGVASFPMHASSRDTLVVAADRALYKSKHSGRNTVSAPPDNMSDEELNGVDLMEVIQRL